MVLLVKLKRPGHAKEGSPSTAEGADSTGTGTPFAHEGIETAGEKALAKAEGAESPKRAISSSQNAAQQSTKTSSLPAERREHGSLSRIEGKFQEDAASSNALITEAEAHSDTDVKALVDALSQSRLQSPHRPGSEIRVNTSEEGASFPETSSASNAKPMAVPLNRSLAASHDRKAKRALSSSKVSVYLAPAVLGHRFVRSSDKEYIVERPERLNASLLGIAALFGRLYSTHSTCQQVQTLVKEEDDAAASLLALASQMESMSVNSAEENMLTQKAPFSTPFTLVLSRAAASLSQPNAGLQAIHAHPDEVLDIADIGQPPAYATSSASPSVDGLIPTAKVAWPSFPTSYVSLLATLCSMAPTRPPNGKPERPKSALHEPFERHEHPSEVPENMSQGDLYLCGNAEKRPVYNNSHSSREELATPALHSFQTDQKDMQFNVMPTTPPRQTAPDMSRRAPQGEDDWIGRGSLGAIEASLGTCCAALDHVVHAAGGLPPADDGQNCEVVDMSHLHSGSMDLSRPLLHPAGDGISSKRAFVLARPPGHHCTATKPSGFCWVNNVAVMASYAYEKHGIDRIAILDFDLHHGDGTQSIVWRINAETAVSDAERAARLKAMQAESAAKSRRGRKSAGSNGHTTQDPQSKIDDASLPGRRGLRISYGSLHDIESFPCEDGDKSKVSDASVSLYGAHGQWIHNVHLECHDNKEAFVASYKARYTSLLDHARRFFAETESDPSRSLVIISAGFDACVHEHPGMQRHGKSVPPEFYTMFTRDAVQLADDYCHGKCVSVLEGGYSDRALTSGVTAHVAGLADIEAAHSEHLCQLSTLTQLDKMAKAASSNMASIASAKSSPTAMLTLSQQGTGRRRNEVSARDPDWMRLALEAFKRLQECCGKERLQRNHGEGSLTAPATPLVSDAWFRQLGDVAWRSPRETRAQRAADSARASPQKTRMD